ncbi:hypothetical protein [Actinacidiphila epipremni]|uniref:Lipoprotein n=1 Tax=Actinacidiphila epipremni TaxID=2053013 RepID=A0ABX0ZPR8_9ACTN|nr:hypothetical protein [Actinacidiphila epipremni]NJP44651.1 hypothetical protein [Actinacidiphila epipremni]
MRPPRAGIPALLVAASAAVLLTACGKAGGATSAGAQLPAATTLAEVDPQLHAYLESMMPAGGKKAVVRRGSVLPDSAVRTNCPAGRAAHVVTEVAVGASDAYATTVLGNLLAHGWHLPAWSSDTPTPDTRFTGAIQAGYTLELEKRLTTVTLYAQTPCLPGPPLPTRSDFPT